jgi:DNA-binding GntR family transcriptional regulator
MSSVPKENFGQKLEQRKVPVDAVTRSEEAYRTLRKVIVRHEIPPGTWLRRRAIAAQLGMSSTPLREAFSRLEHEGLLESIPQWGVRVRTLTVPQFEQVVSMRLALESIVVRNLASRSAEVAYELEKLRPLAAQVDQENAENMRAVASGELQVGVYNPNDTEFHLALGRVAELDMVAREIDRLCLFSATTMVLTRDDPATASHVEILDAILTGDHRRRSGDSR